MVNQETKEYIEEISKIVGLEIMAQVNETINGFGKRIDDEVSGIAADLRVHNREGEIRTGDLKELEREMKELLRLLNDIKSSSENKDTEHDTQIEDIEKDILEIKRGAELEISKLKKDFDAKFNLLWRVTGGTAVVIVLSALAFWLFK
jgi:predicted transcriptional regulator with HTH domain